MAFTPVQPHTADYRIARLQSLLTSVVPVSLDYRTVFWFVVSLAFSAYFASLALHQAFASPFVVQDDARQHVFWMERFLDPQLFPNDLIADYFQSVAPTGYSAFYNLMTHLGIDPMLLNKLLPMALGLITTAYCFLLCLRILPSPGAAFFSTLILNQSLWMQDDLVSATPRAFLYPLFLAFLYYLVNDSRVACLVVIALQGLFYPSTVFITAGVLVLQLVSFEGRRLRLSRARRDYLFCAAGLAVVSCVLLFYAIKLRSVGPVITATEARALPEFWSGGRTSFFGYDFWRFWVTRKRSGLLPDPLLEDLPLYLALLLPLVIYYRRWFPLAQKITESIRVLPRIIITSLFMFAAAHVMLFRLHHPNRYTQHSLRIVFAIAAGTGIAIIFDALFDWARRPSMRAIARKSFAVTLAVIFIVLLVRFPRYVASFPDAKYRVGNAPALYEFFSQQPKDTLVASLAQEVRSIPTFSKRSILVAREYALAYHTRYYAQMQVRASDLIVAHYSADLSVLQSFIRKYAITFFMVNRKAFNAHYIERDSWIQQYQPAAANALNQLERGIAPAISRLMTTCAVFEDEEYVVLSSERILNASLPDNQ
ncbi:MAG: hypothetical protein WBV94_22880 [Blastocatellia bacterium]